ncbi:MAG: tRNA pseudouridine(13) synthase TruD, partial [Chloroflexi bacterium]|nr:tRNA pseudouridine(13) synthase TruD [Chloroflexota bacterium]
ADFVVEEIVRLPIERNGAYTIYRLHKRGITTLQAQVWLASQLGVPRSAVVFPALKDKAAVTTQYGSVLGSGPETVEGPGFRAERVGMSKRALSPHDLIGNRFTVVLRDLSAEQAAGIPEQLARLQRFGFPNYFDEQRFGSYAPGQDWVGKRILLRDAEGALRAHLAEPFVGDPPHVRQFKAQVQQHWGEWRSLLREAPKPSNFRSVLTFLVDHPQDYRKALNLVTPRVLSLYLAAYSSLLWNRLAARYLRDILSQIGVDMNKAVLIAGELLPVYDDLPTACLEQLKMVQIPFFHHRMETTDPKIAEISAAILAEEGMRPEDLKARLLQRAYLPRGARSLLVFPAETSAGRMDMDEMASNRYKRVILFILPPGSYATLMLKILAGGASLVEAGLPFTENQENTDSDDS